MMLDGSKWSLLNCMVLDDNIFCCMVLEIATLHPMELDDCIKSYSATC